ncbi:chorismate synthase [Butyrivibrio sp. INlla16]|uniref:chorismate synthase n=1 Tax=Butyrivibrio sp. INlla16 TaxID=1520807 RepID=UPI0008814681|nr:chorismate synthase [Butyrivibrio sp. INlla16]SDB31178.1 chorismate synthase [Butyrivibrio sp. INlla16]
MSGSTFGKNISMTTWGESHGAALGVVLDGFPAGLELSESDIQSFLDRRKPGSSKVTTPRKENDSVKILSGIFEGKTTGTPISLMVENTSQISADYSEIAGYYRPGHADYGFDKKYGFRDYRGGGRSSGRETIGRVAAGAICHKLLSQLGIDVYAYTRSIGNVAIDDSKFDRAQILNSITAMPDAEADKKATDLIVNCREKGDSVGGVIECKITGMPAGIGEPVFDKLDALLSQAVMSIGAVKAVEIGDGVLVSSAFGSGNNDVFCMNGDKVSKKTNHSGGILGGMSDGTDILLRAHIKPTPSISSTQQTINKENEEIEINIKGRHDPVIVPRAVVVVECMCAFTILDLLMSNMHSRVSYLTDFYTR